jgi:hypothetical protein
MDKENLGIMGLHLEKNLFISRVEDFGRYYSGSRKAKQMKRKRSCMLCATIKGKVMRHNMQTKYNRIRS